MFKARLSNLQSLIWGKWLTIRLSCFKLIINLKLLENKPIVQRISLRLFTGKPKIRLLIVTKQQQNGTQQLEIRVQMTRGVLSLKLQCFKIICAAPVKWHVVVVSSSRYMNFWNEISARDYKSQTKEINKSRDGKLLFESQIHIKTRRSSIGNLEK